MNLWCLWNNTNRDSQVVGVSWLFLPLIEKNEVAVFLKSLKYWKNETQQPGPWWGLCGIKRDFSWSGRTPLYFHTAASPAIAFAPLSLKPQAALAECWDGAGLLSWALVFFLFFGFLISFSWTEVRISLAQGGVCVCIPHDWFISNHTGLQYYT